MTKKDKLALTGLAVITFLFLAVCGLVYYFLLYEPTPERYYFIDMYKEQAEEAKKQANQ